VLAPHPAHPRPELALSLGDTALSDNSKVKILLRLFELGKELAV